MTHFIKVERIKVRTIISENVDDKLLVMALEDAQEFEIKPIIGSKLYDLLISEIEADAVSADNKTLINDYLQPALIKFTLCYAADYIVYKFTNKSISLKTSDNSSPLDLNALQRLKEGFKDKADELAERMKNFLLANKDIYPKYLECTDNISQIRPRASGYAGGFYIDKTKKIQKKFYGR